MACTASGLVLMPHQRALEQIEQLHRADPAARSRSASMRTVPQWQLAVWVFRAIAFSIGLAAKASRRLDRLCQRHSSPESAVFAWRPSAKVVRMTRKTAADLKRDAAIRALEFVEDGMKLGLGTGSTAEAFLDV